MDNAGLQVELAKQLRGVQEKYDYWLLAVAASAIALSVHDTRGLPLRYSLLPLGAAVVAWAVSFCAGCRRQTWIQAAIHTNLGRLRIEGGIDPLAGTHPERIALGLETLDPIFEDQSTRAAKWARWQLRMLVVGALFYLAWHVTEMWLRT